MGSGKSRIDMEQQVYLKILEEGKCRSWLSNVSLRVASVPGTKVPERRNSLRWCLLSHQGETRSGQIDDKGHLTQLPTLPVFPACISKHQEAMLPLDVGLQKEPQLRLETTSQLSLSDRTKELLLKWMIIVGKH